MTGTSLKPLSTRDALPEGEIRKPSGAIYAIDPMQSWVKVFVYRSGALAHLGHNHVVRFEQLAGQVHYLEHNPHAGGLELKISPTAAVIDAVADRAEAGSSFATSPSEKDIAGTRSNMLSAAVLDAQRFPAIHVTSSHVSGLWPSLDIDLQVRVKSVTREITVPVSINSGDGMLTATGRFALSQTELGMTPFSVLGGALAVSDVLEFEYRLVARATN